MFAWRRTKGCWSEGEGACWGEGAEVYREVRRSVAGRGRGRGSVPNFGRPSSKVREALGELLYEKGLNSEIERHHHQQGVGEALYR